MTQQEIEDFLTNPRFDQPMDLYREGILNEVSREIQVYRKRLNLKLTEHIDMSVSCGEYWVTTALCTKEAAEKTKKRNLINKLYCPHMLLNSTENPFKLNNYEEILIKIDIFENGEMTKDVPIPFGFSVK